MKSEIIVAAALLFCATSGRGQGTFIYDQQSATNQSGVTGDGGYEITALQPIGQSFTPVLPAVGFVQLKFDDINRNNGLGATVYVNLRAGSITGAVLGATSPLVLPDDELLNVRTLFFASDIPVVPGTQYYFQPVVQSGDTRWAVIGNFNYTYSGGTAIFLGNPSANGTQLWFREGVVPEPSTGSLLLIGLPTLAFLVRRPRGGCASA